MKIICITLVCSLLILSCGDNDSKEQTIPEPQFINLYADVLILKEEVSLSRSDSLHLKRGLDSLYENYHTSRSEFEATLLYYKKDLPRWKRFYEDVTKRLDSVQLGERQKANK
jgi:hypothetical protein